MLELEHAQWIISPENLGEVCPAFQKTFSVGPGLRRAVVCITAMGVYEARLNGRRVGDFILAPGFTSYRTRLQVQRYDVTELVHQQNTLEVTVGSGWYSGRLAWENKREHFGSHKALLAAVILEYTDHTEILPSDSTWGAAASGILFAEIYDGEIFDARVTPSYRPAAILQADQTNLIPQEGEAVVEQEVLPAVRRFTAPNGDTLVDFGQNITGYVRFTVKAAAGEVVQYSHGEILDAAGNFYNENLRSAKAQIRYICRDGVQTYQPHHTFMGFRYIRLEHAPDEITFEAVVVHSRMKRTGHFSCGHAKLNQLYHNILWSQKGNYLDIPTDCPQRDERLGWTADAQVFVRAGAYNFQVHRFFSKWLADLFADQLPNGSIPHVIPNVLENNDGSAAWGDAAVICPWQMYLSYGDTALLRRYYPQMLRWLDFSRCADRMHFGDWLALDETEGEPQHLTYAPEITPRAGRSNLALISDAFHLYSTSLCIKIGKLLGENTEPWQRHYEEGRAVFQNKYTYKTQTECALALYFHLAKDPAATAAQLASLVEKNGKRLSTGFVGTPYLLHALSEHGYTSLAYDLLLQENFPSWLYSVNRGATTVWEHWDGLREDGTMADSSMNSYNHYAYGAVADWLYGVAAGIQPDEAAPGYAHVLLAPHPDRRLGSVQASVDTDYGTIYSQWRWTDGGVYYHFAIPNKGTVRIGSMETTLSRGVYAFVQRRDGTVEAL